MKKLVPLMVDMAANWYELGAILLEENQEAQLKVIGSTHGSNVRKCCSTMLRYWIDKHPGATWHQLVTALRTPGVDLNSVASNIENNFTSKRNSHYLLNSCFSSPALIYLYYTHIFIIIALLTITFWLNFISPINF